MKARNFLLVSAPSDTRNKNSKLKGIFVSSRLLKKIRIQTESVTSDFWPNTRIPYILTNNTHNCTIDFCQQYSNNGPPHQFVRKTFARLLYAKQCNMAAYLIHARTNLPIYLLIGSYSIPRMPLHLTLYQNNISSKKQLIRVLTPPYSID